MAPAASVHIWRVEAAMARVASGGDDIGSRQIWRQWPEAATSNIYGEQATPSDEGEGRTASGHGRRQWAADLEGGGVLIGGPTRVPLNRLI